MSILFDVLALISSWLFDELYVSSELMVSASDGSFSDDGSDVGASSASSLVIFIISKAFLFCGLAEVGSSGEREDFGQALVVCFTLAMFR